MTKQYHVRVYSDNGNEHYLRLDEETLARLEEDLNEERADLFAQYYCYSDEAVAGVRLDAVELYTVKEVQRNEFD
ncbi:hypothetical protein [Sporosarcina sp. ITBMC105]